MNCMQQNKNGMSIPVVTCEKQQKWVGALMVPSKCFQGIYTYIPSRCI